jgi:hypothetical protein
VPVPISVADVLANALGDALRAEFERLMAYLAAGLATGESLDDLLAVYPWPVLSDAVRSRGVLESLARAYQDGLDRASVALGVGWNVRDERAAAYARARAAEMVGVRRDGDRWVPNPDARWAITDTTRDRVRSLVADAIDRGTSYRDLAAAVEQLDGDGGVFGEARAETIARTELAMAANVGAGEFYRAHGVARVHVFDNEACPVCGPYAGTTQPIDWFLANPVGHPNCIRSAAPVVEEE